MDTIIDLLNAVKDSITNKKKLVTEDMILRDIKIKVTDLSSAERLKVLRAAFKISGKQTADIMGIAYRNYQKYESGDTEPSSEAVRRLSCFTGISSSWILGISNEIYDEGMITSIENAIIYKDSDELTYFILGRVPNFLKMYPLHFLSFDKRYSELENRRKYYSLSVRANIIYLFNVYVSEAFRQECFLIDDENRISLHWLTAIDKLKDLMVQLMKMIYLEGASEDTNAWVDPINPMFDLQGEIDKYTADKDAE